MRKLPVECGVGDASRRAETARVTVARRGHSAWALGSTSSHGREAPSRPKTEGDIRGTLSMNAINMP